MNKKAFAAITLRVWTRARAVGNKEKCRVHVEDVLPILCSGRIEANREITPSSCDAISTPPS